MKYQLNKDELAVFHDKAPHYAYPKGRGGGYQIVARKLLEVVTVTGQVDLGVRMKNGDILENRIRQYATHYRQGGFQDTFLRPVFRRVLNLEEPR
jgi:hypothetical protein